MKTDLATKIHKALINTRLTVAVAESCTGGLVSELLTQKPGSSKYFNLGLVAYSNNAKVKMLGIQKSLITKFGAVSKEVALEMADRVRRHSQSSFGIGITGIAGPTGGSSKKPVGTVFVALASHGKKLCQELRLKGNRSQIREKASLAALNLLNENIPCH